MVLSSLANSRCCCCCALMVVLVPASRVHVILAQTASRIPSRNAAISRSDTDANPHWDGNMIILGRISSLSSSSSSSSSLTS